MRHEWDWPPTRSWRHQRTVYRLTLNTGRRRTHWDSPITKKIVDVYWRTVIGLIKIALAVWLALMAIAAFGLLWTLVALFV